VNQSDAFRSLLELRYQISIAPANQQGFLRSLYNEILPQANDTAKVTNMHPAILKREIPYIQARALGHDRDYAFDIAYRAAVAAGAGPVNPDNGSQPNDAI